MYGGEGYSVRTDGEVILCCGSVQSPQLLELSGIGNSDILQAAGIDAKVNNPNVGENLQDHMSKLTYLPYISVSCLSPGSDGHDIRDRSIYRYSGRPSQ